jgi:hypothetical protein
MLALFVHTPLPWQVYAVNGGDCFNGSQLLVLLCLLHVYPCLRPGPYPCAARIPRTSKLADQPQRRVTLT